MRATLLLWSAPWRIIWWGLSLFPAAESYVWKCIAIFNYNIQEKIFHVQSEANIFCINLPGLHCKFSGMAQSMSSPSTSLVICVLLLQYLMFQVMSVPLRFPFFCILQKHLHYKPLLHLVHKSTL